MMSELMAWAAGGAQGIPIPYSPRMDDGITVILLCCFFLSAYVLSRSRRFLLQLVKDFLLHRERTSIFATSTAGDMRYLLLLRTSSSPKRSFSRSARVVLPLPEPPAMPMIRLFIMQTPSVQNLPVSVEKPAGMDYNRLVYALLPPGSSSSPLS